ncbi:MAG TPA: type II toxin-antitoxin system ParD family antitoxin [Bryobacteraceae bacterium]|nr:type II toxin-antitoxin system ParD family antitoxin [Bryobacteraceae bacterium]
MKISLPESLEAFVEQQVASGKYANAEQYLGALIEADRKQRARERIGGLIQEGLDSGPATDMNAQDWEHIRREGLARIRSDRG